MSTQSNDYSQLSAKDVINKSKEICEVMRRRNPQLSPESKKIVTRLHENIILNRDFRAQKEIDRKHDAMIAEQKQFAFEAELQKQQKLASRQFKEVFASKKIEAENEAYLSSHRS